LPTTTLEPTEAEKAEVWAHAKREKIRRRAPRFTVEQEGTQVRIAPADAHPEAADARMMNAFGTANIDLAKSLIGQIVTATHVQPPGTPLSADALNAAVAAVTGIAPQDEAEAMLAAQMVGVHWLAMDLLRKANDRARLNDAGNLAVKLLRTYTTQLEALKRYRSAGEQRVVVQHQHVNVTADQAAVQVNATPAPRGVGTTAKLEDQSHGQQLGHAPEPTMRCPESARDALPVTGRDGSGSL
jgi:hypothetical protein